MGAANNRKALDPNYGKLRPYSIKLMDENGELFAEIPYSSVFQPTKEGRKQRAISIAIQIIGYLMNPNSQQAQATAKAAGSVDGLKELLPDLPKKFWTYVYDPDGEPLKDPKGDRIVLSNDLGVVPEDAAGDWLELDPAHSLDKATR